MDSLSSVLSQPWLDLEVFGVVEVGSWQLIMDLGDLEGPGDLRGLEGPENFGGLEGQEDLGGCSDKGYVLWLWWGVVWAALLVYKALWSLWVLWLLVCCLLI